MKESFFKLKSQFTEEIIFKKNNNFKDKKMLKGLLNVSAPAVLLSYIRGMISQVTAFSGYPALIIPLINFSE